MAGTNTRAREDITRAIMNLGRPMGELKPAVADAVLVRPDQLLQKPELTRSEVEELMHKAHSQAGVHLRRFRIERPRCWRQIKPKDRKGGQHTWPTLYSTRCFADWWSEREQRRDDALHRRAQQRYAAAQAAHGLNDVLARRIVRAQEILREAGKALTADAVLDRARTIHLAWVVRDGLIIDSLLLPQRAGVQGDVEMLALTEAVCRRRWDDPEIARPWIALWQRLWHAVEDEPARRAAERAEARFGKPPTPRRGDSRHRRA